MTVDTMTTISTAAGLGTAALNWVRDDPQRQAEFIEWFTGQVSDESPPFTLSPSGTGKILECAAITCAGISKMFKEAA